MTEKANEMVAREKREAKKANEATVPGKRYIPATDIVETDSELKIYMDMPGVTKDKLDIRLEKNILEVDGAIDAELYANIRPLYAEYNVGHYTRKFEVSNMIDQDRIEAKIDSGVLTLVLPKAPESQPKQIEIN